MPTINLDLPEHLFAAVRRSPLDFVREMRLARAIRWYARGNISQERAVELAEIDRTDFLLALARDKVAIALDFDDMKDEVALG